MSTFTVRSGSFSWFELATSDQTGAKQFYSSLFGWTSVDHEMGPDGTYTIFKLDGRDVGAVYTMRPDQRAQGVPPNWLVYITVDNADTVAARVAAAGGKVIAPPFDVLDLGRMSVLQDPTGAVFAIWQTKKQSGVGVWGDPGSVAWVDLQTRDQQKAAAFYSEVFGWKMVQGKSMQPAKPGDYYHIVNGSDFIGGVQPPEHMNPHAPPHWLIYIEVDDCRASTAKAKSLGARVFVDTMQIGEGLVFSVVADPQGAAFALHQHQQRR